MSQHDNEPTTTEAAAARTGPSRSGTSMRAVVQRRYGKPDVLALADHPIPEAEGDRVRVQVMAASLNVYDWHWITGTPYLVRSIAGVTKPKRPVPGADLAGVVVSVGPEVTRFAVGDAVFGDAGVGTFAEYAAPREPTLAHKPESVPFDVAAATPMAGLTALQALRDQAGLESGQRVLVNGASGGVGTFAVQIAKALGAEVTAVCSTSKVAIAESIGADHVVDYTRDDFTETERGYDILIDNVGTRPWSQTSRVLAPGGVNVTITGPKHAVMGPTREMAFRKVAASFGDKRMKSFTAKVSSDDLDTLAEMLASGAVVPVIERRYALEQVPEALAYLGEGHAAGKIVIDIAAP